MSVSDYNTDPDLNTTISGINIAEGCPPSGINNAIRQMMADVKTQVDTDGTTYLPLAGGTMTGTLAFSGSHTIRNTDDTDALYLGGGGSLAATAGAKIGLNGSGRGTDPGYFSIQAGNSGGTYVQLIGTPAGALTWGGNNVITAAGGTMTGNLNFNVTEFQVKASANSQSLLLSAGTAWDNGPSLSLYGTGRGDANAGNFAIRAGANAKQLLGKADGTLSWDSKAVECVDSSGTGWIRYVNGLQMCWGHSANKTANGSSSISQAISFPVAFKNSDYGVTFTTRYVSGSWTNNTTLINNNTTTSVELFLQNNTGSAYTFYFVWLAVGLWK